MKYFCLGQEDTVLGFRLAGVEGHAVAALVQAQQVFKTVVGRKDIGILLIDEPTADLIREEVDKLLYSHELPLVMEIPCRTGPKPDRKPVTEIVRKVLGVKA